MKLLRRGTALILSLALLLSLVAVVATPSWTNTTSLGLLSRYYETGKTNTDAQAAATISTVVGDPGGKSYGAYMFTIKSGTVEAFIKWCRNTSINSYGSVEYAIGDALYDAYTTGGTGFGPLFDKTWKQLAEPAPYGYGSAFFSAQEAFSKSNIYDVAIDKITDTKAGENFEIDNYSVALKNVIWSRAVHHGPEGAKDIVIRAFNELGGFANQSESELIMAIYNESGRVVTAEELYKENKKSGATMNGTTAEKYNVDDMILRYWYGSSDSVQLSVYRRLNINEPADALDMLQKNSYTKTSLPDGSYTIKLKKASSTLVLGVSGETLKVVNTADAESGTAAKFTLNYLSGADAYTISTVVDDSVMRLSASKAGRDGFGVVSLAEPSSSDSQLWYIDKNNHLKNADTKTYLSCRGNTLVMVGTDGVSVPANVVASLSESDKAEIFTRTISTNASPNNGDGETGGTEGATTDPSEGIAADPSKNEPSEGTAGTEGDGEAGNTENKVETDTEANTGGSNNTPASETLKVSFAVGENGTLSAEDLSGAITVTDKGFTIGTLPAVNGKDGWTFTGWYTEDGSKVEANSPVAAGELVLYAHYSATSTIERAEWIFSSVVEDISDFMVHQLICPDSDTELHEGASGFPVRGMISCSGIISKVTLRISGPTDLEDSATPNESYYDLSKMDSTILYSELVEGKYTYKLTAKVDGTTYTLKESKFTVESAASAPSTPSGGSENTVTVTFEAGSNGKCTTKSRNYSLDDVVYGKLPKVTPNSGYGFAGWFTEPEGGVEVLPGTQIVAENITLYAQYTEEYTYKFLKANLSSIFASGTAAAGTLFDVPSDAPAKSPDGDYTYTFSHWVDENKTKYYPGDEVVMAEEDMIFTPIYTAKVIDDDDDSSSGGGTTSSGAYWTLMPGTSIDQMETKVYSDDKEVTSGDVATGMTTIVKGKEYIICVKGDASGDGKISVTDVVKLQSHLLNKSSLSGAYLDAADLNGDGKVTITDLVKAARVVAGKEKIG